MTNLAARPFFNQSSESHFQVLDYRQVTGKPGRPGIRKLGLINQTILKAGGDERSIAMRKSRKWILGLAGGLLALALVALVSINLIGQTSTVNAAPAAQAAQATPTAAATKTTPTKPDLAQAQAKVAELNQLLGTFRQGLASRLHIPEDQLDAAVSGALGDTTAQLVKDGKLTQEQANHLTAIAGDLFKGVSIPPSANLIGNFMGLMPFSLDQLRQVESDVAQTLKLQTAELETQLKAGQSLADIAKTQGVDLQKVKDTILSSGKTQLDAAVKAGKLTQQQADQAYQMAPQWLDKLVNLKAGGHQK
jgi:hypothetical protein